MGQIFSSSNPDTAPDPSKPIIPPKERHSSGRHHSYRIHVDLHRNVHIMYLGKPPKGPSYSYYLSTELSLLKDAVARAVTVNSTGDAIGIGSIEALTHAGRMLDIWLSVLKPVPALDIVYAHMDALATLLTAVKKHTYSPPKGFSPSEEKEEAGALLYGRDYSIGSVASPSRTGYLFKDSIVKFYLAIEKYALVTRTGNQIKPWQLEHFGVHRDFTLLRNRLVQDRRKAPTLLDGYAGAMYALSWFERYFWPNLSSESYDGITYLMKFGPNANLRQEVVSGTVDYEAFIHRRKRARKEKVSKMPSPDANEVANFIMRELKAQDEEELELTDCPGMDPK